MGKGARLTVLDDKVHNEEDATDYVVLEIPGDLVNQLHAKLTELQACEAAKASGPNDRWCVHLHVKAENPAFGESLLRQPGDFNMAAYAKSCEDRKAQGATDFFGFRRLSAYDIARKAFPIEPMPEGALPCYDRDLDVAAVVLGENGEGDGYLVLWDPPINKGTVGRKFDTRTEAEEWAKINLEASGWPMNIRIYPTRWATEQGWTAGHGMMDLSYREDAG